MVSLKAKRTHCSIKWCFKSSPTSELAPYRLTTLDVTWSTQRNMSSTQSLLRTPTVQETVALVTSHSSGMFGNARHFAFALAFPAAPVPRPRFDGPMFSLLFWADLFFESVFFFPDVTTDPVITVKRRAVKGRLAATSKIHLASLFASKFGTLLTWRNFNSKSQILNLYYYELFVINHRLIQM